MPIEIGNADVRVAASVAPDDPERRAWIAIAAYYRAERRGFAPGREIEDWLGAEREVDRATTARAASDPEAAAQVASEPAIPTDAGAKAKARRSRASTQRTGRS